MDWIVFYDGQCPLCQRAVRFLLAKDSRKIFKFSPLQGEMARRILPPIRYRDIDTLVLAHNGQIWVEGKAALKILWLLGGKYRLIGWLSFLPSAPADWIYRFIARRRFELFKTEITFNKEDLKDRFLP